MTSVRSILKRPLAFALASVLTACAGDDDPVCTQIGCIDGLEIGFSEPLRSDRPLTLRLQLGDAERIECVTSREDDVDDNECVDASLRPDYFNGGLGGLVLELKHPERVHLVIERDGVMVLESTLQPRYETLMPNGPGCGQCTTSSAPVATPPGEGVESDPLDAGT